MKTFELSVHESCGADGYQVGTWEWRILSSEGELSFSGGWPSREIAFDKGGVKLAKLRGDECRCTRTGRDARGRFTR
jgi:hypothetical protein